MNLILFVLRRICFRLYASGLRDFRMSDLLSWTSKIKINPYWMLVVSSLLVVYGIFTDDRHNHFVVVSATYYKTSPIYEPNTVIILFNGPDQYPFDRAIFCLSESDNPKDTKSVAAKFNYAYDPVGICKWTAYIARCSVSKGLKRLYLTHYGAHNAKVLIPHRQPYVPKKGNNVEVANCFSPFFYNEHWQLVLTSLEVYRHFGSQLQVYYVQSMLESITNVLRKYQTQGLVELEPWASFKLGAEAMEKIGFDPNLELDWRNQASAHTDCFLKYREAAKFIIFGDVDDVLVPQLGGSYIKEFRFQSFAYPKAAGFTYNRYNTELRSTDRLEKFSLTKSIGSARVANEWEDGKYVVNTSRVETAWLHYPGIYDKLRLEMYTIPAEQNIMIHLRNWTISRLTTDSEANTAKRLSHKKLFKTQINDLISANSIAAIEREFRRMMSAHYEVFRQLPTKSHYLPMIIACYDRIFYSRARHPDSCPGPLKCKIPAIKNLRCTVAVRRHVGELVNWRTTLYVPPAEGQFLSSADGCYLG